MKIDPTIRKIKDKRPTLCITYTDVLLSGVGTLGDVLEHDLIPEDLTPAMQEAFALAFPNQSLADLHGMDDSALQGMVNAWKGKYFENLIVDHLNEGGSIDGIALSADQKAVLAELANQPGWDLQILNDDGSIEDLLQIKATDSVSYVQEALERYPEYDIVTTENVNIDGVYQFGIGNDDLNAMIEGAANEMAGQAWQEILSDTLPIVPFLVIIGMEGKNVLVGRKTVLDSMKSGGFRIVKSMISRGVGTIFIALGLSQIGLPISMLTRLALDRIAWQNRMSKKILAMKDNIKSQFKMREEV